MKKEWEIYYSNVGTLHVQLVSMVFAHNLAFQDYKLGDIKPVVVIVR